MLADGSDEIRVRRLVRSAHDRDLPADVDGSAAVRVRSWQAAYRGIVPQAHLDGMDPVVHAERRRALDLAGHHVAERDGRVVGWLSLGPYRVDPDDAGEQPPPGSGEVMAVYVDPDAWDAGIGRALLAYGLEVLRGDGLLPALLWVFAADDRARRFYEAAGFRPDGGAHGFEIAGATLPEVRYRYDG